MKYLTNTESLRNTLRSECAMRKLKRKNLTINRKKKEKHNLPLLHVKLPSFLSLIDKNEREKINTIINKIHNFSKGREKRHIVLLDFSSVTKIAADAMLYVFCELKLAKLKRDPLCFRFQNAKCHKCQHVLKQINFYDELGLSGPQIKKSSYEDVIYWRTFSGTEGNINGYEKHLFPIELQGKPAQLQLGVFNPIGEIIINSVHHAYKRERSRLLSVDNDSDSEKWWSFSQVRNERMTIVICDLGIGIPETFLDKKTFKEYNSFVRSLKNYLNGEIIRDCDLIKELLVKSISSTNKSFRGKGLNRIYMYAKNKKTCNLIIHSNKGFVRLGREDTEARAKEFPTPVRGTIIQLSFDLELR